MPDYDPTVHGNHAQLLFDQFEQSDLPRLWAWLSRRHIDANVTPHAEIRAAFERAMPEILSLEERLAAAEREAQTQIAEEVK